MIMNISASFHPILSNNRQNGIYLYKIGSLNLETYVFCAYDFDSLMHVVKLSYLLMIRLKSQL